MNSKLKIFLKLCVVFMILFTLLSCNKVIVTMNIFDLAGIVICGGTIIILVFIWAISEIYKKLKK